MEQPLAWPLVKMMSARRVKQQWAVSAAIALAVAATVALSYVVTAWVGVKMSGLRDRAAAVSLPFDCVVLFERDEDLQAFLRDKAKWEAVSRMRVFPWAIVDGQGGSLTVLGLADVVDLSRQGATQPFQPVCDSLPGWAQGSAVVVGSLPGAKQGAVFEFTGARDQRPAFLAELQGLGTRYSCTVVSEISGRVLAEEASGRAFGAWQMVSFLVALMSAVAISCILAASFLGRKRTFGILKVLGTTTAGLTRLMFAEVALMGAAGIPLGVAVGLLLVVSSLGWPAVTVWCFAVSASFGVLALALGVVLPAVLIRNGSCDQLLNNRPVYAMTNPSCAKCGLCGGF